MVLFFCAGRLAVKNKNSITRKDFKAEMFMLKWYKIITNHSNIEKIRRYFATHFYF